MSVVGRLRKGVSPCVYGHMLVEGALVAGRSDLNM